MERRAVGGIEAGGQSSAPAGVREDCVETYCDVFFAAAVGDDEVKGALRPSLSQIAVYVPR